KHFFTGKCEGIIGTEEKGENGFGYDPIFCYGDKTLAEMTDDEKNNISHRGEALRLMTEYLKEKR
ncbi:MAG: non-canonical purine NTP pyrophosphatase, partial [Ruminococcus sp.]